MCWSRGLCCCCCCCCCCCLAFLFFFFVEPIFLKNHLYLCQVDLRSITVFFPEKHVVHNTESSEIAVNYSLQTKAGSLPSSLVICFPSLQLLSVSHSPIAVRRSLPVKLPNKESIKKETLPWTLNAENLAAFSVHVKASLVPAVRYLLSPVSSTAVLASAKTSAAVSPTLVVPQFSRQNSTASTGRRISTLGFCVHTDFKPITVSLSRHQVSNTGNLDLCHSVEILLENPIPILLSNSIVWKCLWYGNILEIKLWKKSSFSSVV